MRGVAIPTALRWLLAAVALVGVVWALVVPAWQVPDEDAHFAYAQTVAELQRRPADDGRPIQDAKSTAQRLAERESGFRRSYQRLEVDPEWSAAAAARWRREASRLGEAARRDGGGSNPAQSNPPTFYVYSALAYVAAGGTVLDRLYAMRLWSVPLLLAFAASAWLLAGELAGRDRGGQLCAGALAGLLPMATFVSASVTPDAMLLPLWGLATWLGVRALRRGFTGGRTLALVAVTLAAVAVKPVAVALLPGMLWALGVAVWRRRGAPPPSPRALAAGAAAVAVGGLVVALALAPAGPGRLGSYLWQFYLPELSLVEHFAQLPQWPVRDVWFEGLTGAFGWLEVRFPGWASLVIVVGLAALAALAVRGLRGRRDGAVAVFLLLPALALVAGLHLTEYRFLVLEGEGFAQGRYLLPLVPVAGAAVAAGVATLRDRAAARAAGLVLGGLVVWQLGSLALVTARFYA